MTSPSRTASTTGLENAREEVEVTGCAANFGSKGSRLRDAR